MKKILMISFLCFSSILLIEDAYANAFFWIYNYTRENITVSKIHSSCKTSGNLHYHKGPPLNEDGSISPITVGGPFTAYVGTTSDDWTGGTLLIQGSDGSYCTTCYSDTYMSNIHCYGQFFLSHYPVNSNSVGLDVGKATLKKE